MFFDIIILQDNVFRIVILLPLMLRKLNLIHLVILLPPLLSI